MERPANSARHVAADYYVEHPLHPLQRRNMLRRYCIARLAPLALWHGGTSADLRHSDKALAALVARVMVREKDAVAVLQGCRRSVARM
jgi:hypothetical protein